MTSKHINPERIQELRELDEDQDLLKELTGLFLNSSEEKIKEIGIALKTQDIVSIKKAAHNLRSSCGNIGADAMSELASKIEYLAPDNNYQSTCETLLQNMSDEFSHVKAELLILTKP